MTDITQADLDGAAALIEAYYPADPEMQKLAASIRAGHKWGPFPAAFARHRIAALDEAIAVFDEDIAALAARLGIKPRVVQSPAQWASHVRRAAIEALKGGA